MLDPSARAVRQHANTALKIVVAGGMPCAAGSLVMTP